MEVLLKDEDMVTMVLDFLDARQLYESALALEKETGILPPSAEAMPNQLKYLRNLSLNGEWDNVLFFLEPFTELGEFNTRKLNYLVLHQKYMEILHSMSVNKTCSPKDKDSLKKILIEIQPYCSTRDDLEKMQGLFANYPQASGSLASSRFQCFKSILDILVPFFESYGSTHLGEQANDWVFARAPQPEHTRLESVVTDALFLNECCRCCRERALKGDANSSFAALPFLSTKNLETRELNAASNSAVLFWIRSLKHDDIFRQRYEIEDVQIRTEPIIKHKSAGLLQSFDSPRKFSSFASPAVTSTSKHSHTDARNSSNNNNNNSNDANEDFRPASTVQQNGLSLPSRNGPLISDTEPGISQTRAKSGSFDRQPPTPYPENNQQSPKNTPQSPFPTSASQPLEKPLRNSSNFPISAVQTSPKQNVDASFEKFLEEKRQIQTEKDEFLKNLKEKERRNNEIRKLLHVQQTANTADSSDKMSPTSSPSSNQQRASSNDLNENTAFLKKPIPQLLTASKYIPVEYVEDAQAIRAISFHSGGQVYAVGSNSRTLRICAVPREVTAASCTGGHGDAKSSQDLMMNRSPKFANILAQKTNLHKGSIYCTAWNDEGSLVAAGSNDKLIKLLGFDMLGKTLDESPQEISIHRGIVREVTFLCGSNNALASAGADSMVYVTDCTSKKNTHNLAGHTDQVLSLYSWHNGMLASSSQDKSIRLWDIRTPRCISIIGVGGEEPCVATGLCVSGSGQWLAMGLDNAKVAIYDLRAGNMKAEFKCHSDEVRCVRFNPVAGNFLLSSSYDGSVVITDVERLISESDPKASRQRYWRRISESKNKLIQCKWHPSGDAFATTSVDKTCKLYLKVDS